jgi:hypothetical protein
MAMEYLGLGLRYLQMIGGICVFCKHSKRILIDGNVDCERYGLVKGALRCKDYEPRGKEELQGS